MHGELHKRDAARDRACERILSKRAQHANNFERNAGETGMTMAKATLTISSRNYGVLVAARLAALPDGGARLRGAAWSPRRSATRAELLLLSPSFLVPCLTHDGVEVWDTLAIAEYLNESSPEAGLAARATAPRARIAARFAARCIPASPTCARRCR